MSCGLAGPVMAVYQQKVQESSSSVHKDGCLCWSLEYTGILEAGSVATEGTNLAEGAQEQKLPSTTSFL